MESQQSNVTVAEAPPSYATPAELREAWNELRRTVKGVRAREAARRLGVSEAELVASGIGHNVVKLEGEWNKLIAELEPIGDLMALTRNEHCVHERHGHYRNVSIDGPMGTVLDEEIDLRVFIGAWKYGLAVIEGEGEKERRSLQFFDGAGTALHKVYLQPESSRAAWDALVKRYTAADQSAVLEIEPAAEIALDLSSPEGETLEAFHAGWRAMQDTHEFFGLLRKYGVNRLSALQSAPADLVQQVANDSPRRVLEAASATGQSIMVFVGNNGIIQIHTGPVERIVATGPWINVLDPRFNLHLREDAVASAWIVRKPTRDGVVTSLEVYSATGELIVQFFGKRKPGIPEQEGWRAILAELPAAS